MAFGMPPKQGPLASRNYIEQVVRTFFPAYKRLDIGSDVRDALAGQPSQLDQFKKDRLVPDILTFAQLAKLS
jgi:hypothetical protein